MTGSQDDQHAGTRAPTAAPTAARTRTGTPPTGDGGGLLTGSLAGGDPAPGSDGGAGRFTRASAASLMALAGLVLMVVGPTATALGWHEYVRIRTATTDTSHPLGAEVRDGPVTFVVHEVRCRTTDEGGSLNGKRCEVTVTARNDGEEPVTIPGSAQMLHSPEGVRHLPTSGPRPFGTLAPGQDARAMIKFDVPARVEVTHVGVHADPYSEGAEVRLAGTG